MHLREVRYCVVRTTRKVDASCTWRGLGFGLGFGLGLGLGGRLVHQLIDTGVISSVQYGRL